MSHRNTTDSKRYFDWLFHANLDYLAAQNLINDERCYAATAFHCQQCIEKALKGFMLFRNRKLFDGHSLTWLCKQAMLTDDRFRDYLSDSVKLNKYYIETRYPADIPLEVDYETVQHIFDITTQMLEFICSEIRFDFSSYHKRKNKKTV